MAETVSKRKYAPELRERAFKLYCEEITFATISERWDVPVKVLHRWSCDNKWKQRREELRAKQRATDAGSTSPDPALVDALPENLTLREQQKLYEQAMRLEAIRFVRELANMPEALKIAAADKIEKRDKIARKALKLETDKPSVAINIRMLAEGMVGRVAIASGVPANEPLPLVEETGTNPVTTPSDATSEP